MTLYNWTKVTITIAGDDDDDVVILKPSGNTIYIPFVTETTATDSGVPIVQYTYTPPSLRTLPPYRTGVYYIVPSRVQELIRRSDFISPDKTISSGARYDDGKLISIRQFKLWDKSNRQGGIVS